MSSIVIQGDTSGSITVEAPSVAGTHTLTLPKATGNIATDATVGLGMKNRIINGNMVIDQRNAGAAVSANASFPVDRFVFYDGLGTAVFSSQQIPYTTVVTPVGFTHSLKTTVTTAESAPASGNAHLRQNIEGNSISDIAWGTANAKTITLSFWVRSSVTGTHSGSLRNHDGSRSYPFNFTISSADTWTYITKTIPGDTSGTWNVYTNLTSNAMILTLNLGSQSSQLGTADTWASANYIGTTGSIQLCETLNATIYFTGVQLEVGENATPFENRMYGTELALCQRYYYTGGSGSNKHGALYSGSLYIGQVYFPTTMRASPTITIVSGTGTAGNSSISDFFFTKTNDGNYISNWKADAEL